VFFGLGGRRIRVALLWRRGREGRLVLMLRRKKKGEWKGGLESILEENWTPSAFQKRKREKGKRAASFAGEKGGNSFPSF